MFDKTKRKQEILEESLEFNKANIEIIFAVLKHLCDFAAIPHDDEYMKKSHKRSGYKIIEGTKTNIIYIKDKKPLKDKPKRKAKKRS